MRHTLLLVACFSLSGLNGFAQSGTWTWMNGSSLAGGVGVYGTQGVPGPLNTPPALYEPCEWTDLDGNFWLFGGLNSGKRNALWKYSPLTNEWTWIGGSQLPEAPGDYGVQGVPSPTNWPSARAWGIATWVDGNGDLWMFGGGAVAAFQTNEVWKFDIQTYEWTWMHANSSTTLPVFGVMGVYDPVNTPGGVDETACAWGVDTVAYFFGGRSSSSNYYSGLWEYNKNINQWRWIKGSQGYNENGFYGTKYVEDANNQPPGRSVYARWKDAANNLWFYGGSKSYGGINFQDIWRYSPASNNWTWMGGDTTTNTVEGVYNAPCDTGFSLPNATQENRAACVAANGMFWLFGGFDYTAAYTRSYNTLWLFNPTSNSWLWASGNSNPNPVGNWGTAGIPAPSNVPCGRGGGVAWATAGAFYTFGGEDIGPLPHKVYNDLWRFEPNCNACPSLCEWSAPLPSAHFSSSDTVVCCDNACLDFTNLSSGAATYEWHFPGGTPNVSFVADPSGICYATAGTYNVMLIVTNPGGSDTITMTDFITVACPAAPALTISNDTIFSTPAASYQWYLDSVAIVGANDSFLIPLSNGTYTVVTGDSAGCASSNSIQVSLVPQASIQPIATKICPDSCISFGNNSTNASSYEWFFNGATPNYSTDQFPSNICYATSGLYDVTLIVHNGPYSDTTTSTNLIQVYAPPSPIIVQSNDSLIVTNVTGANTYQWFYNGTIITGATNPFYIPTQIGIYGINVTSAEGCSGSYALQVVNVGVNTIAATDFELFPNPADESVTIITNNSHQAVLKLYNTLGQSVLNVSHVKQTMLDLSLLPAGMYYLTVQSHNDLLAKKLVIGHR